MLAIKSKLEPWGQLLATGLALLIGLVACSKHLPLAAPAAPLTLPTRLCMVGESPPSCRAPQQIEALLSATPKLLGMADTPSGSQGAKILTLSSTARGAQIVFRVRWRAQSSTGLINEPRKELAAYAVQKLFLSEQELVAPPTVAVCLPLADYRRFEPKEPPTFENIDCVLGFASYWLEGGEDVGAAQKSGTLHKSAGIWDQQLFETDPVYRSSVSNANVFTYLINHGDAHEKQFMLEHTRRGLRTYVVDNSIAFLSIKNPMLLVREDWSQIQIPAIPQSLVARLKALTVAQLRALSSIVELEKRDRQLLPSNPNLERIPTDGHAMSWQGPRLRIGLSNREIELVAARVRELVERPEAAAAGP
jgi:hypothetical protein